MTQATRELLNADWKFHLGDVDAPIPNKHISAYMANKAGFAGGAARGTFDDSDWPIVDLPHDWSVEGKLDPANHVDAGFLPRGIAWYRRHFRLEPTDRGKYVALQFDGIATHAAVYVNGHLLHRNFCGYTPFTVDFSDVANFGDQLNVVAIRVDATFMEGWWYEGAGIYRDAWLIKAAPLHFATDGILVRPTKSHGGFWETNVEAFVENTSDSSLTAQVKFKIFDPQNHIVTEGTGRGKFSPRSRLSVLGSFGLIENPQLWSPQSPALYRLQTTLVTDAGEIDQNTTRFGYRTVRFDANEGFFLNDKPIKLKGTCNHQDHAGVGVAVPDSIHRFRIRRLLEMGSNAYRCAHNPPATALLDACDELGMLVMDENRNFGSSPEHLEQLATMVRRDRNHPSIILWSICNEEALQGTPTGANIARTMQQTVSDLDPTRPVTAAVSGGILNDDCIADVIQVMGMNYNLKLYDEYHAKHPNRPIVASETHCTLATRGCYATDPSKYEFASDDSEVATWGASVRETWRAVSSRPFLAGHFAWTGFDYRGEPSPHHWPCINSFFGAMDICGFAKDAFFLHKAYFTAEPFVHLLPHWNWPGPDGKPIRIIAFTNCDTVELFLNGNSLGKRPVDPIEMAHWEVAYQPGELRAQGYRGNQSVAHCTVQTTGPATALGLEVHPSIADSPIPADGEYALPITVFATDANGRRVPTANDRVTFAITGPAKILGVGNGDPTCHEPDKAQSRSLFAGLAQAIVQTTTTPGSIRLTATANGLRDAALELKSIAATPRPRVPAAQARYFVSDWRMSPIHPQRPDLAAPSQDQDMNSWDRIDPANGPQPAWKSNAGFAIYRATFTLPKRLQPVGGQIVFHQISGCAEVYIDGTAAGHKDDPRPASVRIRLEPSSTRQTITVLIHGDAAPATGPTAPTGLAAAIELLPAD